MAPKRTTRQAAAKAAAASSSTSPAVESPAVSSSSKPPSSTIPAVPTAADTSAIVHQAWKSYVADTPRKLKLVDTFMVFLVAVGLVQFVYCILAGNYPFNAFLSGFSITVGQFVLAASLRIQANPNNSSQFEKVTPERAFADFIFGSLVLHFFAYNFIN
ncbi:DAD family-domain-containing protein [Lipomyces tetrasporus]|uniref:Dolichyl-diphosphooligosaccharide--protein glycosyltransferase subunit OST2 n=1 Tax=Lipomyces tetrasporus TaxID=54092 RepID=A0AAD7VUI0_9ASCO|nr:DAD family-domain-containing protein [Lipomyces tetrasporus]KAJ8103162.1 DAD family-domain-containing protein [Lipomyces tetrasporus]